MFKTSIVCDVCNNELRYIGNVNKGALTRLARKEGWSVGKYHKCPRCNHGRKDKTIQDRSKYE